MPATAWWRLLAVAAALILVGLAGAIITPLPAERELLRLMTEPRSATVTVVAHVATVFGDLWFVVTLAVVVALLTRKSPLAVRIRLLLLTSIGGSALIVTTLKLVVARPRPPSAVIATLSSAYPSGHAIRATAVYGLLIWAAHHGIGRMARRYAAMTATMVLMAAIAWSRIYLAVHLPSDVVIGLLLGAVWAVAIVRTVTARDIPPGSERP